MPHLLNPILLDLALARYMGDKTAADKSAFIPAGESGMDPAAAQQGQMPPDAGGEGGGAPPGGGADPNAIAQAVAANLQPIMAANAGGGMGGGMGGGVEPIKPKIDINVTMLQVLKILARIADALGVQIPASEMVATQGDLTSFGMQQQNGAAAGGAGGAAGGGASAIAPIQPMQAAAPGMGGGMGGKTAADAVSGGSPDPALGLARTGTLADAIARVLQIRGDAA